MKVEIWSDVMCPFCYIGKRKFEKALAQFEHKDKVIVEWKSFQLNPNLVTDPTKNTLEHLAQSKGWTMDYTKQTTEHVSNIAKEQDLDFNFEKAVVANSFDAHRLLHLAKKHNLQNECKEQLLKANFIDGKNTADHEVLNNIGINIGLNETEITETLNSNLYANEVNEDIYHAQQVGVKGVPFFVLGNKYAISGAQEPETFLGALNKTFLETNEQQLAAGF
jgi:predicted DsbA family dithiol-disulfide isomerase